MPMMTGHLRGEIVSGGARGWRGKGDVLAVGFCHAGIPAVDIDTGDTGADEYERHLGGLNRDGFWGCRGVRLGKLYCGGKGRWYVV